MTGNLLWVTLAIMFTVSIKRKVLKEVEKMPDAVQERLAVLLEDLKERGPVQRGWPNFSRIGKETYHCHLARNWVAC